MIFVPVGWETADGLRSGGRIGPLRGFAATPSLLSAHGLDPDRDSEEAAVTAQAYAMTAGLVDGLWVDGHRVVLAVELADDTVTDEVADLGGVTAAAIEWRQVQAVFSDGPEPDRDRSAAVTAAAASVCGIELGSAVDAAVVDALLEEHDLLWHVPDEAW